MVSVPRLLPSMVLFILIVSKTMSASLETTPSHVDGVLTVYSGDKISLKCSHNNLVSGVTRWSFTAPLECSEAIIDHNPPITTNPCGQFTFQDVTEIMLGRLLNSTAVATATSVMSGAMVECRDSTGLAPNLIGRVTLCITDLPQPPSDITWSVVSGGRGVISWTPVPQPTCSTQQLTYSITLAQLPPGSLPLRLTTTQSSTELSSVQGNTTYLVVVRTMIDAEELVSETAGTLTFNSGGDAQSHNTTPTILVPSCSTTSPMSPISTSPPSVTSSSTSESCSCNDTRSVTPPIESPVTISKPKNQQNCSLDTSAGVRDSDNATLILAVAVVLTSIISIAVGALTGSVITYVIIRRANKRDIGKGQSSHVIESLNPVYDEINISELTSSQKINTDSNVAYGHSFSRNVSSLSMPRT